MADEQRYDLSRLSNSKVRRTPSQGALIPASLTRVGILSYTRADGSKQLEFRSPTEVFREDSLASLRDAPVLEGHPAMVDPSNWEKYSKGHVSGTPRADGDFVAGELAVQSGPTLARIDRGEVSELSCGYTCKTRPWSGEWQGRHYDGIVEQYDIRYNHVGLGPKGWGRAGEQVALRLDGGVCDHNVGETPKEVRKMKVRFDGKDYEAGSEEHVLAILTKLDSRETELKTVTAERDTAQGQVAALTTKLDQANKDLAEARSQARIDSAVSERLALVTSAAKVLGPDYKFDGKTTLEIQTAVIAVATPEVKLDGRSADFVAGCYETAVRTGKRADGIESVPGRLSEIEARAGRKPEERKDAAEESRKAARTPKFEAPAVGASK